MTEAAYRRGFRVTQRLRALEPDEARALSERERAWRATALRDLQIEGTMLTVAGAATLAFGLVARLGRNVALSVSLGFTGVVMAVIGYLTRRRRRAEAASLASPFTPPGSEPWQVELWEVDALRVIGALSDVESMRHYWLFEVPGSAWFYLDASLVLGHHPGDRSVARARVRLARLYPLGLCQSFTAEGEPLPVAGALDAVRDPLEALATGQVWAPGVTLDPSCGLVDADTLPGWVLALSDRGSEAV